LDGNSKLHCLGGCCTVAEIRTKEMIKIYFPFVL
jgi:hypothetical protein